MTFRVKTNAEPWLNLAIFRTETGETVFVDRDATKYTYNKDTGIMDMQWKGCYIWNGEICDYDIDRVALSELVAFEIEDDAPEGYFCIPQECCIASTSIPVAKGGTHS